MQQEQSEKQPKYAYVTRLESFSAAHRLHSPFLSDDDNRTLYGKCNHENYHGHNYDVEVTVKGEIDRRTGMVMNLTSLKSIMKSVIDTMDHRNLDKDVEFFKLNPSTSENVAVYIWNEVNASLKASHKTISLYEVKVHETKHNVAIYRGE